MNVQLQVLLASYSNSMPGDIVRHAIEQCVFWDAVHVGICRAYQKHMSAFDGQL